MKRFRVNLAGGTYKPVEAENFKADDQWVVFFVGGHETMRFNKNVIFMIETEEIEEAKSAILSVS